MGPKILIMYYSRTGNTEKLAEAVAEGVKRVSEATVELKRAESVTPEDVIGADGYAVGSPSHFGIMSGQILTLLTDLYSIRHKMAGKPMAVFTTGTGGQVTALENIERIIGVFNPRFVKPGIAVEGAPREADKLQAAKLGEKLAKALVKKAS
ncbi:MAG: flavodoxin domain-containing protein [Candidatus Bathyarchaeota archaeon]|nr:flavodoxin domain-containing protein [Candidatus Bathyarchaeota archaeon]